MDEQTHRVKIPCNHILRYLDLKYAIDPRHWFYRSPSHDCNGCGDSTGYGYYCSTCEFGAHVDCIDVPDIINHPSHSKHPLKNVLTKTVDYTDGRCHFCRRILGERMYHCSICNFSIDMDCWIMEPPVTIYQPKSHNHAFTLMPVKNTFTCTACGTDGDRNPYICVQCGLMLHKDCIDLPRVININRHDHRISRTYHLGHGNWESCGVCRKEIDWTLGGFSCKRCPNYAVHSKCAIRNDVWDERELEDEPEEEEERDPYEVINEKEIKHYIHEHHLRLGDDDDNVTEMRYCDACVLPINSDPFFKCVQCEFFLHKVCASLPWKKRNIMHNHRLSREGYYYWMPNHFKCTYCLRFCGGLKYVCDGDCNITLDVRCGSISEPFHHELHPHPLYRTSTKRKNCGACGKLSKYVLSCIVCEFALGMECATLPRELKHRCDDHVLSLHHGAGNSKGQFWCDICEGKTDPSVWYYGCNDCGVTLHINCVLGDMYYLKLGSKYRDGELVLNNGMTRPLCVGCDKRCMFPFFLKGIAKPDSSAPYYVCSMECAREDISTMDIREMLSRVHERLTRHLP